MRRTAHDPVQRTKHEAALICPPLPDEFAYLWNAFLRLNARRSVGFAIEPITFLELDAFTRLSGLRLRPWEIAILEDLDLLFRKVHAVKRDAE